MAGLVLAGASAAGLRRRQRNTTARRLTLEEVDNLTLEDLPSDFVAKMTIGRARRRKYGWEIRERLDTAFFVFVISRMKMPAKDQDALRAGLPDGCTSIIAKRTFLSKVLTLAPGWNNLGEAMMAQPLGPSILVIVPDDSTLKPTIEYVTKMEKKWGRKATLTALVEEQGKFKNKYFDGRSLVLGMLRGDPNVINGDKIPSLKDLPTKQQTIGMIAGGIKQITTKLARSTKQVGQKVAIGLKKITEKMEEQGKGSVKDIAV